MKFSVIVPVYNAEKYLEKCILSVIRQSYRDWELILVDDGSKDTSSQIVDDYAKKDKRVIAVHQENSGPGIARNNGIKKATGDYVIFLDSDDFIDKDYFSLLAPKAECADVVFIDVLQVSPDGKVLSKELMSSYKGWTKDRILRSQMTGKLPWGGVRKAVRKSILTDNNIHYTDHKVGEEALYSFRVVYAAESVAFLDEKPVYYYVNHEGSQSKTVMEDPWGEVVTTIANYLKTNGLYKDFADTVNAFAITAMVVSIDKINILYKKNTKKKLLKNRIEKFKRDYDYSANTDLNSMSVKAKIFVPFIKRGLIWPVVISSNLKKLI